MKNRLVMAFVFVHMLAFGRSDLGNYENEIAAHSSETDFLVNLAQRYAPQLREHEDESYPLANAAWFIKNAGLMLVQNGQEKILIPPGQVTMEKLATLTVDIGGKKEPALRTNGHQNDLTDLRLFIPKTNYEAITQSLGASPVCYAHPRFTNNGETIDISYFFFFPYNGTVSSNVPFVSSILEELGVGHHEGDWEHITVRTDKSGKAIKGIFFAAHGASEGKWHLTEEADLNSERGFKLKNGQPIVWTTRETHGSHNYAGTIHREPPSVFKKIIKFFGILVEETSNDGKYYDCRTMLQVVSPQNPAQSHPWLLFRGRWGGEAPKSKADDYGPEGPMFKDWWHKEP